MLESGPQGFAMIPRWLLLDESVKPAAKLAYAALASYTNKRGVCWPSHATLARVTGLSVSTVQRSVAELIEMGAVTKEPRPRKSGGKGSNRYFIHNHLPGDNPVDEESDRSQ